MVRKGDGKKKKYVVDGLELDEAAQAAVREYNLATDVPIKAIVRRVLRWFVQQPPVVQRVVMGQPEKPMRLAYAEVLEHIARTLREMENVQPTAEELGKAARGGSPKGLPAKGAIIQGGAAKLTDRPGTESRPNPKAQSGE